MLNRSLPDDFFKNMPNFLETIFSDHELHPEIRDDSLALSRQMVSTQEVTDALAALDPVWETLAPKEQARIVRLLVERVEYDGEKGKVTMTFRPSGLRALGEDLIREEAAA